MRFDDSLRTVLAADTTSAFGAQSAFRQLVDLIGRRRVEDIASAIDRLRELRSQVPASVRAASARALALAEPPAALVAFFAEDEPAIVAPLIRSARLGADDWAALLPRIGPTGRALLRARDGLPAATVRGLAAFGTTDFTIGHDAPIGGSVTLAPVPATGERSIGGELHVQQVGNASQAQSETAEVPFGQSFAIADLVERIETFHRVRERAEPTEESGADRFSFEADPRGVICWVDGIRRAGLIGRTLGPIGSPAPNQVLTVTLHVDATGGAGGEWDVSAVPLFAPESGRFSGFRGIARRVDRGAGSSPIEPEALRRLVHELRTPTNAIAGFAELIATELLGPTPAAHRARAVAIGRDVNALIGAIEDLEISARMDVQALELTPRPVDLDAALATAVGRIHGETRPRLPAPTGLRVVADERALDRLLFRLAETIADGLASGEEPEIVVRAEATTVTIGWPWLRQGASDPLLGIDFSLRLAQRLATTLGGTLVIQADRLTLHLPASITDHVQATNL